MIEKEKLLIEICRAYFNSNSPELPDNINFKELFRLAKHHNLLGVCHCILNHPKYQNTVSMQLSEALKNTFYDSIYIYECQQACLNEVRNLLTESEIRHILFKGIVLRNLYPVPESRTMGDIDLLIEEKNRNQVKSLLMHAGYTCTRHATVYTYQKNGIVLEVHTRLISEFGNEAFRDAFDNAVFTDFTGVFHDDYHTAYIIAHIAHHFIDYGAGIRHILDLAVLQKERTIHTESVLNILKDIKLDVFAKVILSVCNEWFGVGEKFVEDTQKTQDFMCTCGAFGTLNRNNGAVVSRKQMLKNSKISSAGIKLLHAFPPYEQMRRIGYINFVDGRPWLTPYAWCYRFFYNLKNRRSAMMKTVHEIDDEKIQQLAKQELAYFEEIGLI